MEKVIDDLKQVIFSY